MEVTKIHLKVIQAINLPIVFPLIKVMTQKKLTQNSKMISVIAAVAANRAIGLENKLLYWLPNDLKRFKALTTGHTIIMGRRTFESLPKGALPNRRNIVISRTQTSFPGCDTYSSLEEAIAYIDDDELVEVTPKNIRLRKRYLDPHERKRQSRAD